MAGQGTWRALCATLPLLAALAGVDTAAAQDTTLEQAARRYPPMILGGNVYPTDGSGPYPRSCPTGGRVETRGGPTIEYLGSSPANPDLCRMRVGGQVVEAWFAIWLLTWPGHEQAYPALQQVIRGRSGDVVGFDVRMMPGAQWHDLIRNEGIEDIELHGTVYRAMKLSHYREGFDGNRYRSVATVWKDIPTGMLIYGTYHHIAGRPEIDDVLIPTRIVPGP